MSKKVRAHVRAKLSRQASILTILQERRFISGTILRRTFGVSERTLYRDMAQLQAEGHPIKGEAGVGYMWKGNCVPGARRATVPLMTRIDI